MAPYCFPPLSQKSSIIRLLRLLPSKDEAGDLRCELLEYTLQESGTAYRPYEAVSYVWGGESKPQSITIMCDQPDNSELSITQNLHTVLLRLRDRQFPRIIWADAICINQADREEKEHQIPFMAAIYAKASRVIVWLGEAEHGSDRALESLRIVGEKSGERLNSEKLEQNIIQLLDRPWFSRIWVLQEVAAARHVIIMCGSTEIDGHAFCLGLETLTKFLGDSKYLVASLIRGAIFRSRQTSTKQGRLSLDICSLGELLDMYHAYSATNRHDKVYALLSMSSDGLSEVGLEPDYNVSWGALMRSLVRFLLGDHATIDTWNDREMAVIKNKGCTLGHVSSVTTRQERGGNIQITFDYRLRHAQQRKPNTISWRLSCSAKPIKEGDLICLFQGAQKPTIVRSFEDYFIIIVITATPLEQTQMVWPDPLKLGNYFTREFLLVWDWENSTENMQEPGKYDILTQSSKTALDDNLDKATRKWNCAQILGESGQYKKAKRKEQHATIALSTTLRAAHLAPESKYSLIPLSWAAEMGHKNIVSMLISKDGVGLEEKNWRGQTPLSCATKKGHVVIVKLLLGTEKTQIDVKDNNGRTPLSWAASSGNRTIVDLLLQTGKTNTNSMDENGQTPLSWASTKGYKDIFKLLLDVSTTEINLKDNYGRTPLWQAAANRREGIVKLLLETGKTEVDWKDNYGRTPLSCAAGNGSRSIVKLLLDTNKTEADSKDNYGRTPLWHAAGNGHKAIVELLLETNITNADSKDKYGRTPLWRAAGNGREALVKLLLETGKVKIDSRDNYGRSPLLWAAESGHTNIVKLLLETGKVKVNSKDNYSQTPLSRAARTGHEAIVKLLLIAGTKVDLKEDEGRTALSLSAGIGHESIVKLLLEIGNADAQLEDDDGRTPLSWAAGNGHVAIVKLLLKTGNVTADSKDDNGRTPLSWAAGNGHETIVKLLQPYS